MPNCRLWTIRVLFSNDLAVVTLSTPAPIGPTINVACMPRQGECMSAGQEGSVRSNAHQLPVAFSRPPPFCKRNNAFPWAEKSDFRTVGLQV